MGLLISWAIPADRVPSAASVSARRAARSSVTRSVTSRAIIEAPTTRPPASLRGEIVSDTWIRWPSFLTRTVS